MGTDLEEFLEHFGKKGMHWGQRAKRSAGITGVGVAGGAAGLALVSPGFRKFLGPKLQLPVKVAIVGVSSALAMRATRNFLESKGEMKVSDIPQGN